MALALPAYDFRPAAAPQPRPAPATDLSPVERMVVDVAVADARRGGAPDWSETLPARLRRFADRMLGRRPVRQLADPRLEALRRFAFLAARGQDHIGTMRALRDAGFTLAQAVIASRLARPC